jgi:predicted transcriptional regulator
MKRKSINPLGETEMEVLQHVWDLRQATVADVQERILKHRKVAYTTIMTVMKNLAEKGYLQYEKDGATYVYSAARPPAEVQQTLLDQLVQKVFRGSPLALVQTLVRHEHLSDEERAAIRKLIDDLEEGHEKHT